MWGADALARAGRQAVLLLKKILEGFARIFGPSGARGRGLFLHSHAHGIERTLIALVLAGDALRDGLTTFEAAGGIEIGALPAGVQLEAAFWAVAGWLGSGGQQGSALSAPRNCVRSRHVYRTRAEGILLNRLLR